jgi:hypothetical protein
VRRSTTGINARVNNSDKEAPSIGYRPKLTETFKLKGEATGGIDPRKNHLTGRYELKEGLRMNYHDQTKVDIKNGVTSYGQEPTLRISISLHKMRQHH